jgi:UDP-glucose 4-epimerase
MRRAALAGASGLIGHAIGERLRAVGWELRTLGRRGAQVAFDLERDAVLDPAALEGCDALVHAAGVTDEDLADPARAAAKLTRGMPALLAAARAVGIPRLVYISTAHVYGALEGRIDESRAADPKSDYARAHLATEEAFRAAAREACGALLIARPCAAYGMPPSIARFARWSLIPFDFPRQALTGRIVLRSHGEQRRNFVPAEGIGNLVGWWLEGAASGATVANAPGRSEMSVYDFARLCARITATVAGIDCEVVRPAVPSTLPARFEYLTRVGGHLPGPTLEEHVERLVRTLIQEHAT